MVAAQTIISPNEAAFLYLKKSFCIIECMRLNKIININNEAVDLHKLENELMGDLASIKENFIYPFDVLRQDRCIIDLELLSYKVNTILHPGYGEETPEKQPETLCNKITENDVYNGVNKDKAFQRFKERFLESNSYWTDIGHSFVNLMESIKELFNRLNAYLSFSRSDSAMDLAKAVHCINLLEYLDWVFNLIQHDESIFDH